MADSELCAVTDASFDREVLQRDKPVLVDFWAQWCAPCHMITPILAEVAAERAGSLTVLKINSDENPVTTRKYQVMAMPTLLLFRDGEPVQMLVGARPKSQILKHVDDALQ